MSTINLRRPPVVDITSFPPGHDRRLAGVNNRIIGEVYAETQTDAPKILAAIRWKLLHLFRSRFAEAVGIGKATVAEMERDRPEGSRLQRDVYTKVVQYLTPERIGQEVREQLLQAFVPGSTTLDFEERVGYEIGFTRMLELIGIGDKAWYQRRKTDVVADPGELMHLVHHAYPGKREEQVDLRTVRMKQAMDAWKQQTAERYRSRTLEEPLGQLLTDLELLCLRDNSIPFSVRSICDLTGCTEETASDLLNARLVPWERVEPVADALYGASADFHNAWAEAEEDDRHRERFDQAFTAIRDGNGMTNAELVACLGVVAPEHRRKGYAAERTEGYRPSAEIRRAIQLGSFFGQVQMRALTELVAESAGEGVELERIFRLEREHHYRRTGSAVTGDRLHLRIDREWNGVTLEMLAQANLGAHARPDAVEEEVKRLNGIEIAHGSGGVESDHCIADLRRAIRTIGTQQCEEAARKKRERRGEVAPGACSGATTVQGFMQALHDWLRSFRKVQRTISNETQDRSLKLSQPRMTKILSGTVVPTLPILENMSRALLGTPLPSAVKADWYDQFAERGALRGSEKVSDPIERILATVVGEKAASPVAFAEERMTGNAKTFWMTLRPNTRCPKIRWENVEAILLGADITSAKPIWWLLRKILKEEMKFRSALQSTVAIMTNKKMKVSPSTLIGVSWEQLSNVGVRKPKDQ
jgi:DNA-binding XRE family transcriptional regulator